MGAMARRQENWEASGHSSKVPSDSSSDAWNMDVLSSSSYTPLGVSSHDASRTTPHEDKNASNCAQERRGTAHGRAWCATQQSWGLPSTQTKRPRPFGVSSVHAQVQSRRHRAIFTSGCRFPLIGSFLELELEL